MATWKRHPTEPQSEAKGNWYSSINYLIPTRQQDDHCAFIGHIIMLIIEIMWNVPSVFFT